MRLHVPESGELERFLSVCQVAELLGMSKRGVYRLVARGELPPPVKVGQLSRWPASEVVAAQVRMMGKRENRR